MDIGRILEVSIPFLLVGMGICVISALYGLYLLLSAQGDPKMRQSALSFGYGGVYGGLFMVMIIMVCAGFPKN